MHTPVLLNEVLSYLKIKKNGLYIDATFGEGGHTKEILKKGGKVLGIEADESQIKKIDKNLKFKIQNSELILVQGNFSDIEEIAKKNNFFPVDGILFDLGLSIDQIKESGRGFSYKKLDEPLDMRIAKNLKNKASDLINSLNRQKLYEILAKYSEEIYSRPIADAIVCARARKKIQKVKDLVSIIYQVVSRKDEKILARIFQALRIAVNDELKNLKRGLEGALKILKKEGRILIISFHSVEDRLIKQFVKEKKLKFETKKPIFGKNYLSFERSAKLRIIKF